MAPTKISTNSSSDNRGFHDVQDAPYFLPNDSTEHDRLDEQARHLSQLMGGQLLHSPIDSKAVGGVLDIGAGTGTVTTTFAKQFPEAKVFGLDLSKVPKLGDRPSNLHYLQGNVMTQRPTEWIDQDCRGTTLPQDENLFDLIFSRLLIDGIDDWPAFLKKELQMLKPGGYVEVHELQGATFNSKAQLISEDWEWMKLVEKMTAKTGIDFQCGAKIEAWMRDAGFEDVQVREYRLPLGGGLEESELMREFGEFWYHNVVRVFDVILQYGVKQELGLSDEEVQRLREQSKAHLRKDRGDFMKFFVTFGRKPGRT